MLRFNVSVDRKGKTKIYEQEDIPEEVFFVSKLASIEGILG